MVIDCFWFLLPSEKDVLEKIKQKLFELANIDMSNDDLCESNYLAIQFYSNKFYKIHNENKLYDLKNFYDNEEITIDTFFNIKSISEEGAMI